MSVMHWEEGPPSIQGLTSFPSPIRVRPSRRAPPFRSGHTHSIRRRGSCPPRRPRRPRPCRILVGCASGCAPPLFGDQVAGGWVHTVKRDTNSLLANQKRDVDVADGRHSPAVPYPCPCPTHRPTSRAPLAPGSWLFALPTPPSPLHSPASAHAYAESSRNHSL